MQGWDSGILKFLAIKHSIRAPGKEARIWDRVRTAMVCGGGSGDGVGCENGDR